MPDIQPSSLQQLQSLLRDLFQLDLADLDFGIYRLLRLKRTEVEGFLTEQLPRSVSEAFESDTGAERATIERAIEEQRTELRRMLGADAVLPNGEVAPAYAATPLAVSYAAKLQRLRDVRATEEQKTEVFSHLYNFFRRYYHAGEFIPRHHYGAREHFAVPYKGDETFFHWANRGQHYVKTGERLRDYAFRVDAGLEGEFCVRFTLSAAHLPPGNTKGDARYFFPLPADAEWDAEARTLRLPFHYRLPTAMEAERYGTRNGRLQEAVLLEALPALLDAAPEALRAELSRAERRAGEPEDAEPPAELLRHLRRFVRRHTSDYFVHRDLKGFLTRELEFYLKDQVLHLADVTEGDWPARQRTLRVLRRIADDLITFLAQIEEVQKRLFQKRKLVLRADYLVLIRAVPRELWPEVAANPAQLEVWKRLFHLDSDDLFDPSGELNTAFLEQHPTLVVHTALFPLDFRDRMLASFEDLDAAPGSVLIHSENYQALRLLERRYAGRVKCIYIDPPYNTGSDDFIYKDRYQHSSWLTMMEERLRIARMLLREDGAIFVSIDDKEQANLKRLLDEVFGAENFVDTVIWQKVYAPKSSARHLSADHDFLPVYARSSVVWRPTLLPRTEAANARYRNEDEDPRGLWKPGDLSARNYYSKGQYTVTSPSGKQFRNPPGTYWRVSFEKFQELDRDNRIWWGPAGENMPAIKRFLSEVRQGLVPQTLWSYKEVGHTQEAKQELLAVVEFKRTEDVLNTVKPTRLIRRVLQINTAVAEGHSVIDFFAGSGTTADAVIRQNREDGGNRCFVIAEMGQYFDDIVMQRVPRILHAPEWKERRPTRLPTPEEAEHTPALVKVLRLESYEDALHNLTTEETQAREAPRSRAHRAALGEDAYRLRYLARLPLAASASMLMLEGLDHPFAYTLETLTESGPVRQSVDLVETFNLCYGLQVQRLEWWEHPDEGRRYRAVSGHDRDGRRTLVLWRDTEGLDPEAERRWLEPKLAAAEPRYETVLINGDSATPGVRSLVPDFKRLLEEEE
ncbi:hypothetical protein BH24GEM3_BH24GEM3_03050 [soil metagenome]